MLTKKFEICQPDIMVGDEEVYHGVEYFQIDLYTFVDYYS